MNNNKDLSLLVEIAHMYYEEGAKQSEVAEAFNISRSLVSKYLTRARETGIVEIIIHDDFLHPHRNLEKKLKVKFDLTNAIVVPSQDDKQVQKKRVANAAVKFLLRKMENKATVAVAPGTTIYSMISSIPSTVKHKDALFVSITGGLGNKQTDIQSNVLCDLFAQKLEAKKLELHAPVTMDSEEAKKIMMDQSSVKKVLNKAKTADIAVVGIGGKPVYSTMTNAYMGQMNPEDELKHPEIVGDICYNFIDKNGRLVDCEWNKRVISIDLESIKKIPLVIAVAEGKEKVDSIYASIKGNLIDVIVTDSATAMDLLEK
ncbi:MAG: sugar-binding transcriptional regulator [Carnobacterium sp.]|uniref:sugar-binding transcriptional regulator n=1 Tax=Carnobacterium sp. TaxID=48221 RepID=UPI003315D791